MLKKAYIVRITGIDESNYRKTYETEDGIALIAGVDDKESGNRLIMDLIEGGYEQISLGYGFTERDIEKIRGEEEFQKMAADKLKLRCVKYTINGFAGLKRRDRVRSHGVIMAVPGVDRAAAIFLADKVHDTRVVFVKNISQARHAARYLVKNNVGFIELCIWFDRFRMEEVIEAIDGAVPVGTCGDLTMQELEPEIDPEKLKPKKRVYKRRK